MTEQTPSAPAAVVAAAATGAGPRVRFAVRGDLSTVVALIHELAAYENLSHLAVATPQTLEPHLFGNHPACECLLAELDGQAVGFALFFPTFSTFAGRPGLWLEDLFVRPEARGAGLGRLLVQRVAQLAVERDCGRFEWSVLEWNTDAQGFYQRLGATVLPDWRICRTTGAALRAMAGLDRFKETTS
jgi:GNAT superfamily N-acetyltransferase